MNIKNDLSDKKTLLLFSFIGFIGLFLLRYLDKSGVCFNYPAEGWLPQSKCKVSSNFLFISPFILLGTLIFNKYRDGGVFKKWKKFTFAYLGLYLVVYLVSPTSPPDFLPIYKETVALGAILLYFLTSLGIFIFSKRK